MKSSDLVFIGIKGSVIALDRATGQQVWATHLKGSNFVNVAVQNGAVLALAWAWPQSRRNRFRAPATRLC
jgi:outer membrane protein assembly factor BamB